MSESGPGVSRRALLKAGALGAAGIAAAGSLGAGEAEADVTEGGTLPPGRYSMNAGWLFGGVYATGAEQPGYSEAGFGQVELPHTVTPLSWGNWSPASWEKFWIYRKHISSTAVAGGRSFVDFQAVMTTATVWLNGNLLAVHEGGYLPFSVELTEHLVAGDNVLAVRVNATLQDIPPSNLAAGDAAIDYLQPGGINRDVALRIVPEVAIADVWANPQTVLTSPGLDVQVTLNAAIAANATVTATLAGPSGTIASATTQLAVTAGHTYTTTLGMSGLTGISLWSPESPTLYVVTVTVSAGGGTDQFALTTGFREATFTPEGFFLNGARYEIFGLNRHGLFPYLGMGAPARLQRRDAEIIKNELNCNMVRCSHYPQSEYFLDACDELGLMVWEEPPGWQYLGDTAFQQVVLQNVEDMVLRDRSRPSVIVWAARLNETGNAQSLYSQTNQVIATLDPTRQTTGAMDIYSTSGWTEQVFAYDDYHSVGGQGLQATLNPPLPGVPYMVSEAVGALDGAPLYRWVDPQATLALQGQMHAEVHGVAQGNPAYAGLLGWCAIDYQSLNGGNRIWNDVKWPGVTDTFRVQKPGAGFYASQVAPATAPVIVPGFFWDFGASSPAAGPGDGAIVFTNCQQLRFFVGNSTTPTITGTPDTTAYPNLAYAPVVVDFPAVSGSTKPSLTIQGLVGGQVVTTLHMSSNTATDRLSLTLDDAAIDADGTDATRFTMRAVDQYGNHRPGTVGQVTLSVSGPATLACDNPFPLDGLGGVGGGFLISQPGVAGTVTLTATHPTLGSAAATLATVAGGPAPGSAGSPPPRMLTAPPGVTKPFVSGATASAIARSAKSFTDAGLRAELRRLLTPRGLAARIGRLLSDGYQLSFEAPSAGRLVIGWYREVTVVRHHRHEQRRILVASADARAKKAGRMRCRVRLNARGKTLLKHATSERLEAEAIFTPKGRRKVSATGTFTLRR